MVRAWGWVWGFWEGVGRRVMPIVLRGGKVELGGLERWEKSAVEG